jgi:phosphatidylserine/phosphatidylglycerophosphate/cardiolipin synthase-like enzyme
MKLQIQLSGTFHRLLLTGTESISISLGDLMREVQAVATQNRRRTPQLLRQSFGLDFIPESVLINLCKQANGIIQDHELYQVPSLKLLQPLHSQLNNQNINTYFYQFTSKEVNLQLTPDDPQIPIFTGNISEQTGIYNLTLEKPNYPGLDNDYAQTIWNNSRDYWENLTNIEKIKYALQSRDLNNFYINYQQIKIWLSIQELPLELRSAITFLRLNENETSNLSIPVKLLIDEYQSKYRYQPINLPEQLQPNYILSPKSEFLIRSGKNRSIVQKIINDACEFLLISSYIIEDEELTELICKKSSQLPQGVWILTDLRNEVLDRIDEQISDNVSISEQYQITDERKKACLKMLIDENIPIRSGAFHLKTYISEQYAYLGSCNLTRGSLDFNKEAGIVVSNNSPHQPLINLFKQFWQKCSKDEVIPDSNNDGFRLRSLLYSSQERYTKYPNFLNPSQYERDLIQQLRNFQGDVKIYSRSFQPSAEIANYLRLLDTNIFIDSRMSVTNQDLNIHRINNLHAKITILGNQVAYIGGINFNFNNSHSHDLMYKTTDTREINKIISQLPSLHS